MTNLLILWNWNIKIKIQFQFWMTISGEGSYMIFLKGFYFQIQLKLFSHSQLIRIRGFDNVKAFLICLSFHFNLVSLHSGFSYFTASWLSAARMRKSWEKRNQEEKKYLLFEIGFFGNYILSFVKRFEMKTSFFLSWLNLSLERSI